MDFRKLIKILIVDDEKHITQILSHTLEQQGYVTRQAHSGREAVEAVTTDPRIALVLLDVKLGDEDGREVLQQVRSLNSDVDVVMVSGHGTIEMAVECLRAGAVDFIEKPFKKERLLAAVERALKIKELTWDVQRLKRQAESRHRFDALVGASRVMQDLFERMRAALDNDSTILILGETGTGKDLVARTIHQNSHRARGPFIPVNCAALPAELIESELFGYKKGAFTGANVDSAGIFKAAEGGTVFLDEITEAPPPVQAKLLRVLQDKRIRPVGSTEEIPVDVRIICSTNRDIEREVSSGRFREDLFFRISVITLNVPPLRERREDIPLLVDAFIERFNRKFNRQVKGIDPEAMKVLLSHNWKGNVRELENCIESAFATGRPGPFITVESLPAQIVKKAEDRRVDRPMRLDQAEREAVIRALKAARGNKSRAASLLGITRKRLYHLIKKYGL